MNILGLHSGVTLGQHDPGAALIIDGELVVAVEEERLLRVKSPRGHLPIRAISACLKEANLTINDIDIIGHAGDTYEDMPARIHSYMIHYFGHCPKIQMINHQLAHLASAFYCSDFSDAICISWDAFGDNLSAAFAMGSRDKGIKILETRKNDESLGNFYATLTSFIGFDAGEDEFKVMGLAPYGKNEKDLSGFARPNDTGYVVDQSYMRSDPPLLSRFEPFYSPKLQKELEMKPRRADTEITQQHRDIAFSAQKTLERCAQSMVQYLHDKTGLRNLCLAGGVALNCSANNVLKQMDCVDNIFIQPAASDRGLPLGCALQIAFEMKTPSFGLKHVYLGPTIEKNAIEDALKLTGHVYEIVDDPATITAQMIAEGQIVGWFQGRSEFGPRALGNRSILADPSRPGMKDKINARVKFREEFRPFAPAVIEEKASEIFDITESSPFMTIACNVHDDWKDKLPATTHINGTARVQTVKASDNPEFHRLITKLGELTNVPVVLNTSFNVRGQPIVESPIEAIGTFAATGLDALVMGHYVIRKHAPCQTG